MTRLILLVAVQLLGSALCAQPLQRFEFSRGLMGTEFRIVLFAPDSSVATGAADAAFDRVASLNGVMSDYAPDSELNAVSSVAGSDDPIVVSEDLWYVLRFSQQLATHTDGAFDVTVGPLTRLWRRAMRRATMPEEQELAEARAKVGYRLMELDTLGTGVRLDTPGMRLDLGGVAKGYAADQALAVLRERGFTHALVDAGGDLAIGDPPPDEDGWAIEMSVVDADGDRKRHTVSFSNTGIATSGATFRYLEHDGKRYSHILDPTTGLGITTEREVTVVAPTCMFADALASALSVAGAERGAVVLDHYPGSQARFVEATGDGYRMVDIP